MLPSKNNKRGRKCSFFNIIIFGLYIFALWIFFQNKNQPLHTQVMTPRTIVSVDRVIDGDTIEVIFDGKKETVRLLGIDTAEFGDSGKPVECFAKEAFLQMKNLVEGKTVRLENDASQKDRDIYGRLLRYVYLENGTDVNKDMILQGFAHQYTFKGQPYRYQKEYKDAELIARSKNIGLWNKEVCP